MQSLITKIWFKKSYLKRCSLPTKNYIIKYLVFCTETEFCNKIYGAQFYGLVKDSLPILKF